MPKKLPPKVPVKLLIPRDLIPEVDEIVNDEAFDGRGDLALTLIRWNIYERKRLRGLNKEFAIIDEKNREREKSI